MELLIALPAELVAAADPSARGAAPLLRAGETDADSRVLPCSFEACLALLAVPLPAGNPSPFAGNELPAAPYDSAAAAPVLSRRDGEDPPASGADEVLLAPLRLLPAAPSAVQPAAEVNAPQASLELEPTAPAADGRQPAVLRALAIESAADVDVVQAAPEPRLTEALQRDRYDVPTRATPPPSAQLSSWLDALVSRGERRPKEALLAASDSRSSPAPVAATAPPTDPAHVAPRANAVAVRVGAPADDAPNIAQPSGVVLSEAPSAPRPEWLPSQHGNAPSAAASAAPGAPVDTRSPTWHEAFASRVQYLVDAEVGEARIKLNPPELGAVDVKISLVDDKTYVQLTAATAAARDELAQSLPRLRELFTASGLELGGATVHNGREGQHGGQRNDADGAAANASPLRPFAGDADQAPARPPRSSGRIDVFA